MILCFQVVAFFGFAILSFACGLVFYVIFEAPVLTLLNIIYEKLVEKSKSNNLEQCWADGADDVYLKVI